MHAVPASTKSLVTVLMETSATRDIDRSDQGDAPMPAKTPMEMYEELVQRAFIKQGRTEPTNLMVPTAYISVPTTLAFVSPPVSVGVGSGEKQDAKLGTRPKGNRKRKGRSKR